MYIEENSAALADLSVPEVIPELIEEEWHDRANILLFRSASGSESVVPPIRRPPRTPRLSLVTAASIGTPIISPESTPPSSVGRHKSLGLYPSLLTPVFKPSPISISSASSSSDSSPSQKPRTLQPQPRSLKCHISVSAVLQRTQEDDCETLYSHASAVELAALDDDAAAAAVLEGDGQVSVTSQALVTQRRSFRQSFQRPQVEVTRRAALASPTPVVVENIPVVSTTPKSDLDVSSASNNNTNNNNITAPPSTARTDVTNKPVKPRSMEVLVELIASALASLLKYSAESHGDLTRRVAASGSLLTNDEKTVIALFLRATSRCVRLESASPWLDTGYSEAKFDLISDYTDDTIDEAPESLFLGDAAVPWSVSRPSTPPPSPSIVNTVIFGPSSKSTIALSDVAQSRSRPRCGLTSALPDTLTIPLAFGTTFTALLATLIRLDCRTTLRSPRRCHSLLYQQMSLARGCVDDTVLREASLWLRTRYCNSRLSFAVSLRGHMPCTIRFHRPGIFSLYKIDRYACLVTEVRTALSDFVNTITGIDQNIMSKSKIAS